MFDVQTQDLAFSYPRKLMRHMAQWYYRHVWCMYTHRHIHIYICMHRILPSAIPGSSWEIWRNGIIGLCASIVSDLFSNCARILKTYKQTSSK